MTNEFIAGRACLDFANTVDWRTSQAPEELLHGYDELLAWAVRAGILERDQAARLEREAKAHPRSAAQAFERALALREAIHRIFRAHAHGDAPSADDLALVAHAYADAIANAEFARPSSRRGYAWSFDRSSSELDRVVWPLALSAVELLESDELPRVRECGGRDCGWLFLDETRNHGRRWCVSAACGNRERVRRYYARRTKPRAGRQAV